MKTVMNPAETPVSYLSGVGAKISEQLARLNIFTLEDLLLHLPIRYEDRTTVTPINTLIAGQTAVVEGVIEECEVKSGKKRILICSLNDGTGSLVLTFFHFYPSQLKKFQSGTKIRCFGEVREGFHSLEIVHPHYEMIHANQPSQSSQLLQETLTPVYATTNNLHQQTWHHLLKQTLQIACLPEYLPDELLKTFNLLPLQHALQILHFPPVDTSLELLQTHTHPAHYRLAFEELLARFLSLRVINQQIRQFKAPAFNDHEPLLQRFLAQLPFELTMAQQRVYQEVRADLQNTYPMQRLLQGDVGSGKTVIAALAALQAMAADYQVAVMAPTEILAEQHRNTFSHWLTPFAIEVTWLTGRLTKKQRKQALTAISEGNTQLVIGTHALFQAQVNFAKLGLVIIDEQHRFGVHQRLALRDKGQQTGYHPHQLIITATPIPRTLTMTLYADLELSVIDELPPGRQPINTAIIPNTRREEVIDRIRHVCQAGRQAYWVCPLIEESDTLQLQAAEETARYLIACLPELQIGLIHGRMTPKEKDAVMAAFKGQTLHLLVATTVIEVGVDVPNASLMIIENPERLGLSQLHQLRGRVGRGAVDSYCLLLYQPPLSELAKARLSTIRNNQDGFVIAQKDLELRGPGEILGARQTGLLNYRVADFQRDKAAIPQVKQAAEVLLTTHPTVIPLLMQRWVKKDFRYATVG